MVQRKFIFRSRIDDGAVGARRTQRKTHARHGIEGANGMNAHTEALELTAKTANFPVGMSVALGTILQSQSLPSDRRACSLSFLSRSVMLSLWQTRLGELLHSWNNVFNGLWQCFLPPHQQFFSKGMPCQSIFELF